MSLNQFEFFFVISDKLYQMNFLAHIYLSGNNDLIKIGNFMADGMRGKSFDLYPKDIQKGIFLHREIDSFTDFHPIFRKSKHKLHDNYGHYSGVITDIFYDHFLAKNWAIYSKDPLDVYAQRFYQTLHDHYNLLTDKIQNLMPYMIHQNWLVSYATIEGISTILEQMDRRTQYQSKMKNSPQELIENYNDFEVEFTAFFEELRHFVNQKQLEK